MARFENLSYGKQEQLKGCVWFQTIVEQAEKALGGSARLDRKQNLILQSGQIFCPACPVSVAMEASEVTEDFRLDVFGAQDAGCLMNLLA